MPGLVISPYAKSGYIDHQQLSHDAYLKFIEDDFLSSARLDPATDGRPDRRPDVREEAPGLGDLANDFDFNQSPRPPAAAADAPRTRPGLQSPGTGPAERRDDGRPARRVELGHAHRHRSTPTANP